MEEIIKKQKMVHYDRESDVLYFGVQSGDEEEFVEIAPGVAVELNNKKKVIGVEIMNASKMLRPIMKMT